MSVINVVRIAKIVALLAFVLPWVAVSCSIPGQGQVDLVTASGLELIQGKMTANPDAEKQMGQGLGGMFGAPPGSPGADGGMQTSSSTNVPELGMNIFAAAAALVTLIGLGLSFVGNGKATGRNVLVTSLVAAALVFGSAWWWKDQIKKQGNEGGGASASAPFGGPQDSPFGGGMGGMGAGMMDQMLQERFGYWIALSALLASAGAGAVVMTGGLPSAKPASAPPPAA